MIDWLYIIFKDNNCINGSKLRTYRLYKDRLVTEPYVTDASITRYERSLYAKLRSGTLPLEVETGRYKQKPLEERICKLCKSGIEDEIHFLIDCDFYTDLRYNMFNEMSNVHDDYVEQPSLVKFILLMYSKNVKIVANTIFKMYMRRKIYL